MYYIHIYSVCVYARTYYIKIQNILVNSLLFYNNNYCILF